MHEDINYFWHCLDEERPFNLLMAGTSYCDKTYVIERQGVDYLSFEYIIDGTGTLEIDGKTLHPSKNDIYILPKNKKYKYYADADNPWVKSFLVFSGPLAEALFSIYLPESTYLIKDCNIERFMKECIRLANRGQDDYDSLAEQTSELVFKIAQHIRSHQKKQILSVAQQMRQWLDLNIENTVKLEELSNQMHYSKNRMITLFKEAYGQTPYSYLKSQKIEVAKQYLQNTTLPVYEISAKLSFADAHYFSGSFKAAAGCSPLEYRRQAANSAS